VKKALFEGLVFDTNDQPLGVTWVGDDPSYVLDDGGFLRHIPAEEVDQQVWDTLTSGISGNEDFLSEQTAKILGQEDIFSIAVIRQQLENSQAQFEQLRSTGLPQDMRNYLGMTGFQNRGGFPWRRRRDQATGYHSPRRGRVILLELTQVN